jgi:plasmid maintenance system antidote protein VapI
MAVESAKVTLGELVRGLTVFQAITCLALAVTTLLALWSWRDGLVSEKAVLQTRLVEAETRTNALAESLKRTENTVQSLQQAGKELRTDLAKRLTNNSRIETCAFIQKEIARVNLDIANARDAVVILRENNTDREERSVHLARMADQLRTLTLSLEACAR